MSERTPEQILDEMIEYWRNSDEEYAEYYVDALRSARRNIVGKVKP